MTIWDNLTKILYFKYLCFAMCKYRCISSFLHMLYENQHYILRSYFYFVYMCMCDFFFFNMPIRFSPPFSIYFLILTWFFIIILAKVHVRVILFQGYLCKLLGYVWIVWGAHFMLLDWEFQCLYRINFLCVFFRT